MFPNILNHKQFSFTRIKYSIIPEKILVNFQYSRHDLECKDRWSIARTGLKVNVLKKMKKDASRFRTDQLKN